MNSRERAQRTQKQSHLQKGCNRVAARFGRNDFRPGGHGMKRILLLAAQRYQFDLPYRTEISAGWLPGTSCQASFIQSLRDTNQLFFVFTAVSTQLPPMTTLLPN